MRQRTEREREERGGGQRKDHSIGGEATDKLQNKKLISTVPVFGSDTGSLHIRGTKKKGGGGETGGNHHIYVAELGVDF